jgi:hypothetical protein
LINNNGEEKKLKHNNLVIEKRLKNTIKPSEMALRFGKRYIKIIKKYSQN